MKTETNQPETLSKELKRLEKALKDRPILPVEIPKEEYDRVIDYLITIGFFKNFIN